MLSGAWQCSHLLPVHEPSIVLAGHQCEHTLFLSTHAGIRTQCLCPKPCKLGHKSGYPGAVCTLYHFCYFWGCPLFCTRHYARVSKWHLTGRNGVIMYTVTYRVLKVWTQHHFVPVPRHWVPGTKCGQPHTLRSWSTSIYGFKTLI